MKFEQSKKSVTGKKLKASVALDNKGGVEIVGKEIILHGQDAEQVKEFCQRTGIPPKVLLTEMLRVIAERCKAEKPKKIRAINWQRYADDLWKRLETWKQKHKAQTRG